MQRIAIMSVLLAHHASAQTSGFWLMGTAPGTIRSYATALTQDGLIAAGYCTPPPFMDPTSGFTWTQSGGRYDFGLEPGMPGATPAFGISSDGGIVVGSMASPAPDRAYRRIGTGPLQDLGSGGYQYSRAIAVSGSGAIVAVNGTSTVQGVPVGQAFRWTESGGLQPLGWLHGSGRLSQANGVSRDGSTIVGQSAVGLASEAFVWRESTGMQPLMPPVGWSSLNSYARGVSADGTAIVGDAEAPDHSIHIIRWTPGGPQDLGLGAGSCVSDDGNVIGLVGGGVWTSATGGLALTDYLGLFGVSVTPGWSVRNVYAISGDGKTFAGEAFFPATGAIQGFVATIPAPAGAVVLLIPTLTCRRRRRA